MNKYEINITEEATQILNDMYQLTDNFFGQRVSRLPVNYDKFNLLQKQ